MVDAGGGLCGACEKSLQACAPHDGKHLHLPQCMIVLVQLLGNSLADHGIDGGGVGG